MAAPETKIKVTADTSQAERKIKDLEKALEDIQGVASAAGKALGVITAAGAAIGVAVGLTIQKFSDLADAAEAIGISAQNLGYLQQSAQLAGVGADELNAALRRLQANLGDALIKGTGPGIDALKRLQVPLQDIINLPADEQLKKISAALKDIPNPAERSALAMDLLGKQGPRLLEAADAMDKMKQRAQELGLALSDVDVQAIRDADDALTELKFLFDGALKKAAAAIAPYIIAISEAIGDAVVEAGGFDRILASVVDTIKLVTKAAAIMLTFFAAAKMTAGIIAAVAAMTKMYEAIKLATTAAGILNAVLGKNPIIKIVGALAAIGGSVVVLKEIDDMFADLDKKAQGVMTDINKKVDEQKGKTQDVVDVNKQVNEVQKKALEALDDTITKLRQQVDYQKNILKFGQVEADIQKVIAEEREKLKKVGKDLLPDQEKSIRNLTLEAEQIKRQIDLRKFIITLGENVDYQKNILRYGQQEADILKVIADQRKKVAEAGKTLSPIDEQNIRNALEMENSLKRQITLRSEQAQIRFSAIEADYSPVEAAIQKHINYRLSIEGNTSEEIKKLREQEFAQNERLRDAADKASEDSVFKALHIEVAKYDKLFAMRLRHKDELKALLDLELLQSAGVLELSVGVQRTIEQAKTNLIREQQEERIKLEEETQQKILDATLNRINRSLMAEQAKIAAEGGFRAASIADADREALQKIGQQEKLKTIVADRIAFEKKSEFEKVQFGIEQAANLFSTLGKENKKAFEAAKAFNIANAIMNTYMAATKALATYPFPFGLIAAAGAVAAGMAQVGAIRSQQYSGRALGGPVMASQSYVVGENGPEMFTPATTGRITRNSDMPNGGGVTNINFTIVANDTSGFDQLLTSRKGVIQQIISDAMLERGQRSMM